MIFLRLLIAALLSLLIMPVANTLAPEQEVDVNIPFSAATLAALNTHLSDASARYGVPTPTLRFVTSKAPGLTRQTANGSKATEIRLGDPTRQSLFQQQPELLIAVVSHEFGHAVMIARHQDYPLWVILAMYATGFFPLLLVMPTIRSILASSTLLVAALAGLMLIPRFAIAHNAYQALVFALGTGAVISSFIWPTVQPGPALKRYLPSMRAFGIAGAVAVVGYVTAAQIAGSMNKERELLADMFGACLTSPTSMRDALFALSDKPNPTLDDTSDLFHPSMKERSSNLADMHNAGYQTKVCDALLANTVVPKTPRP